MATNREKESVLRWLSYMGLRSSMQALAVFHLPFFIAFSTALACAIIFIVKSGLGILASSAVSILFWCGCFATMVYGYIGRRAQYLAIFGRSAYRVAAFRFLLPYGVFWLCNVTMPAWVPGHRLISMWFAIPGIFLVAVGILLLKKTVEVFGIDRLIYVYSYYPKDAGIITSDIFEIIRHPAYAGWIYIGLGAALIRGSAESIAAIVFNGIAIALLIRFEERDIVTNSMPGYAAYRARVPAFFPRGPMTLLKFIVAR